MDKPKLKYGDVFAVKYQEGTVAYYIEQRIKESRKPGARPLGPSHFYTLRRLQSQAIGAKQAATLKAADLLEHCRSRIAAGVQAPTVNQDVCFLRGTLKYASVAWDAEVALEVFTKAKPLLEKEQLIGKSRPRTRRPTHEELTMLLEHFAKQNLHPRTETDMVLVTEFSYHSARRISETCRLRYMDVDTVKRTCWVYNLKNPKGKGEHAEFPLLGRAWELVERRMREIEAEIQDEEQRKTARLFPFCAKTCSQRYTMAKKVLGIKGLRLHDNRREAISRLFEQGFGVPEVAKVSLHKNPSLLLGTYTAIKPESLHLGPASKR